MTTSNILVVEDERIIAKGIERELRGMGYTVMGLASTGEDAVHQATELKPDLVLMDIHLEGDMDGVEAANLIYTRLGIPIVYLTAHSDNTTLQRAKVTEPFGYLLKPYEDKDLQTVIEIGLYKSKMERRLRENEQWLASTLASIGDGVIATDKNGQVKFLNPVAEQLVEWTQADAIGQDVQKVFHIIEGTTRQPAPNPILDALANGSPTSLAPNTFLISKGGSEYPLEDSAAPIRGMNGMTSGAVMIFRNITERRRMEEQLRQAQKLETIGKLAGGIAHDFNNIIAVIMWLSELLLANNLTAKRIREIARNILTASEQAALLTRQIMTFSRKQTPTLAVLNLNTILLDMEPIIKSLTGSSIAFVFELAPDLSPVKADPSQIGQIILNLVANARDAMPTGGQLIVATANVELGTEVIDRRPKVKPGRYTMLSCSDNGSGISEEILPLIFDPFFTTKQIDKGTGLGLATLAEIINQSGGHIDVSSKVGEGSTFRVYLPVAAENLTTKPSSPNVQLPATHHETILLVEIHDAVREMIALFLQQQGYTVLEAPNGLKGVEVAESYQGTIHLVLSDLVLPKLSGRKMFDRLTALRPGLRVLFMSGHAEDMMSQESAGSDLLQKPFTVASLTQKVREILDRE